MLLSIPEALQLVGVDIRTLALALVLGKVQGYRFDGEVPIPVDPRHWRRHGIDVERSLLAIAPYPYAFAVGPGSASPDGDWSRVAIDRASLLAHFGQPAAPSVPTTTAMPLIKNEKRLVKYEQLMAKNDISAEEAYRQIATDEGPGRDWKVIKQGVSRGRSYRRRREDSKG